MLSSIGGVGIYQYIPASASSKALSPASTGAVSQGEYSVVYPILYMTANPCRAESNVALSASHFSNLND
jgi:hypothetical protein